MLLVASVVLTRPLPNVTTAVVIRGHNTLCKDRKFKFCRIDGRGLHRHFLVGKGGRLQLTQLMLTRGYTRAGSGGSIFLLKGAVAILNQVHFRGNSAFGTTAGGGAIEVEDGAKLFSSSSHFIRNTAGFGGAIAAAQNAYLSLYGNIFHRNIAATSGGALSFVLNTKAVILRSQFTANEAGQGGAIHVDSSSVSLCNATYYSNSATLMAPNFLAQGKSTMTLCSVPKSSVVTTGPAKTATSCVGCK